MSNKERWKNFDFWLFGVVIVLCFFGIVMIQSALAGNLEVSINSQILYCCIGLSFVLACAFFDYHYLDSLANILYIGIILLLLALRLFGTAAFGSARWFRLGPISLQPSEFAKTILIIRLAKYFADHDHEKHDMRWLIMSFCMAFGIVVFILLQPNMSTSIVMMVLWFSMVWMAGIPTKKLLLLGLCGIVGGIGVLAWIFISPETVPFVQEYQINRVKTFLAPDPDARYGDSYNIDQAVISLGSGKLTGQGYGNGTQVQLRFLKVRHTDFIFSALGQEFGFIGAMLVIITLSFMVLRIVYVGRHASDFFGGLICYGIATLFFFQMVVNMGVNLQVLPVTGLTLPFISYGGSSTMALAMSIGLVECVAVNKEKKAEL